SRNNNGTSPHVSPPSAETATLFPQLSRSRTQPWESLLKGSSRSSNGECIGNVRVLTAARRDERVAWNVYHTLLTSSRDAHFFRAAFRAKTFAEWVAELKRSARAS